MNLDCVYIIMMVASVFGGIVGNVYYQCTFDNFMLVHYLERLCWVPLHTHLGYFMFVLTALWIVAVTFLSCRGLYFYPLFENDETLHFIRIKHDRIFRLLFRRSVILKMYSCPALNDRQISHHEKKSGHWFSKTSSSSSANHSCWWIVESCWSYMGGCNCVYAIQSLNVSMQ